MSLRVLILAGLLVVASFSTSAITIDLLDPANNQLYNTGVNSSGIALANNSVDAHYQWLNKPGTNPDTNAYAWRDVDWPIQGGNLWRLNSIGVAGEPDSVWIAPAPAVTGTNDNFSPGNYAITTTFNLPNLSGLLGYELILQGTLWSDNRVNSVQLYGPGGGPALSTSAIAGTDQDYRLVNGRTFGFNLSNLTAGIYTIQFNLVNAAGASRNPAGLHVRWSEGLATGVVPEPGTYVLMATVGLALFLLSRWRRFQSV